MGKLSNCLGRSLLTVAALTSCAIGAYVSSYFSDIATVSSKQERQAIVQVVEAPVYNLPSQSIAFPTPTPIPTPIPTQSSQSVLEKIVQLLQPKDDSPSEIQERPIGHVEQPDEKLYQPPEIQEKEPYKVNLPILMKPDFEELFYKNIAIIEDIMLTCVQATTTRAAHKYGLEHPELSAAYIKRNLVPCTEGFRTLENISLDIIINEPSVEILYDGAAIISNVSFPVEARHKFQDLQKTWDQFEFHYQLPEDFKDPLKGFTQTECGIWLMKMGDEIFMKFDLDFYRSSPIDISAPGCEFHFGVTEPLEIQSPDTFANNNPQYTYIFNGVPHYLDTQRLGQYSLYFSTAQEHSEGRRPEGIVFTNNSIYIVDDISQVPGNQSVIAITGRFNNLVRDGEITPRYFRGHPNYKSEYDDPNNKRARTSFGIDKCMENELQFPNPYGNNFLQQCNKDFWFNYYGVGEELATILHTAERHKYVLFSDVADNVDGGYSRVLIGNGFNISGRDLKSFFVVMAKPYSP
jgi:hypothetical protein